MAKKCQSFEAYEEAVKQVAQSSNEQNYDARIENLEAANPAFAAHLEEVAQERAADLDVLLRRKSFRVVE